MDTNTEEDIKKFQREEFKKLKKEENKNREIPTSNDILYISDFEIEKYSNLGDSGELLLATSKHNKEEKYIIKHEYYECACNEYMYSKFGNKMDIKIAPVKLFIIDDKVDKFKSDFVCGIKYFENSKHVIFKDVENNKSINNWKDYIKMIALEALFDEDDGIEVLKYKDSIYRIDTQAAFRISEFAIYPLAYDYNKNGINLKEFAEKNIMRNSQRRSKYNLDMWHSRLESIKNHFGLKYLPYFFETFESIEKITDKDLEEWTNTLTYLYPNIIGEYFKNYIINLKTDAKEFLISVKDKEKEHINS